jgi:hypothetical protein
MKYTYVKTKFLPETFSTNTRHNLTLNFVGQDVFLSDKNVEKSRYRSLFNPCI